MYRQFSFRVPNFTREIARARRSAGSRNESRDISRIFYIFRTMQKPLVLHPRTRWQGRLRETGKLICHELLYGQSLREHPLCQLFWENKRGPARATGVRALFAPSIADPLRSDRATVGGWSRRKSSSPRRTASSAVARHRLRMRLQLPRGCKVNQRLPRR